jgi:hypothetical protein
MSQVLNHISVLSRSVVRAHLEGLKKNIYFYQFLYTQLHSIQYFFKFKIPVKNQCSTYVDPVEMDSDWTVTVTIESRDLF